MKGLHGDFATMPLKDVLVYLGNQKSTGILVLQRGRARKQMTLVEGNLVTASSTEPREYLGQFLINMGHLTDAQFIKAYQTQQETQVPFGKIVTMIGLVSEETVKNALTLKIRETVLEAFNWTDGLFDFDPHDAPPIPDGVEVRIDLTELHREGEFREAAWSAIRAAFPSGMARLTVDESKLPERPKPGSLDERLVGLIRSGQTIDEMVLALHATDFYLYQRLYALYRLGAVTVQEESVEISESFSEDEPLGPTESADALSNEAERLLTSASLDLLKRAETALLDQLKATFLTPRPIPVLRLNANQLKGLPLTAPERYLLSRVDGERDVSAIVHVSPLRELDALKYFQRFLAERWIELKRG